MELPVFPVGGPRFMVVTNTRSLTDTYGGIKWNRTT
jgi:hypothetical protein